MNVPQVWRHNLAYISLFYFVFFLKMKVDAAHIIGRWRSCGGGGVVMDGFSSAGTAIRGLVSGTGCLPPTNFKVRVGVGGGNKDVRDRTRFGQTK